MNNCGHPALAPIPPISPEFPAKQKSISKIQQMRAQQPLPPNLLMVNIQPDQGLLQTNFDLEAVTTSGF